MTPVLWIGIIGTIVALAFAVNGVRVIRAGDGHTARAGRLHILMVICFVPILWMIVLIMQMR